MNAAIASRKTEGQRSDDPNEPCHLCHDACGQHEVDE